MNSYSSCCISPTAQIHLLFYNSFSSSQCWGEGLSQLSEGLHCPSITAVKQWLEDVLKFTCIYTPHRWDIHLHVHVKVNFVMMMLSILFLADGVWGCGAPSTTVAVLLTILTACLKTYWKALKWNTTCGNKGKWDNEGHVMIGVSFTGPWGEESRAEEHMHQLSWEQFKELQECKMILEGL